jgi:anti-sigma factor RsiW
MNCDELYRRLTDHAEGALEKDACAALEAHLSTCPSCVALQGDLQDLARLCRESAPTPMPAAVRDRIQSLISY